MSQTTGSQCPTPSIRVGFDYGFYQYRVHQIRESEIANGLVVGLYGVLVVLSVQSVYALAQSRRTRTAGILLSLAILALLTSTTVYVVVTFIYNESFYLDEMLSSAADLWEFDPEPDFNSARSVWDLQRDCTWLYQRTGTAAVMINIILGDAIVCWRACVVWNRNRVVQAVCGVFLLATFLLGILDATLGSRVLLDHVGVVRVLSSQPGALFEDNSFGLATCMLSLTTNLVATLLIAYKAWKSRRRLRGYLVAKTGGTQAQKLFGILIESGVVYCTIWLIVVVYQFTNYSYNRGSDDTPTPDSEVHFLDIFGVVMNGALVPVIAIYPTIIIVLVASNKSHMEQGLGQSTHSAPTSHSVEAVDAITTRRSESTSRQRSDVLLISASRRDSEDGVEHTSTNASEEWKLERIV